MKRQMLCGFDIPDYKKIRAIIDTDAACEADDPYQLRLQGIRGVSALLG